MNDLDFRSELLRSTLSVAVPLEIERLRGRSPDELCEMARECAQTIASKGDVIQFRSARRGETAAAFADLARGLAAMCLVRPEGVRFLGVQWTDPRHADKVAP